MPSEQATLWFEILVVDDEPQVSDLLTRTAQKDFPEAKFSSTQSVQQTLDYLRSCTDRPPQLILLDINLGQSADGLSLLPTLQAYFKGQVPLIILSGLNEKVTIKQAYEQGAIAYTRKPEDLPGWHTYVMMLKQYWHQSVCLPSRNQSLNLG